MQLIRGWLREPTFGSLCKTSEICKELSMLNA